MIKAINSIKEVNLDIGADVSVFLDVDHTIINTNCFIAHPKFQYFRVFDALKKLMQEGRVAKDYAQFILGVFRTGRCELLIEDEWLEFIQGVKNKGAKLLALTSMNTGEFPGMSPLVEEWRYNILKDLGVVFSENNKIEKLTNDAQDYVINFHGIIQTGKYSKYDSLKAYFQNLDIKPKTIVFFDDRQNHLDEVAKFAAGNDLNYQGYLYRGVMNFQFSEYVVQHANRQLEILLKQGKFLSNAEIISGQDGGKKELIDDAGYNLILTESANLYDLDLGQAP
jgi:hypothetical protein